MNEELRMKDVGFFIKIFLANPFILTEVRILFFKILQNILANFCIICTMLLLFKLFL